jgi:hypothetical protein
MPDDQPSRPRHRQRIAAVIVGPIVALALVAAVAGCGDDDDAATTTETSTTTERETTTTAPTTTTTTAPTTSTTAAPPTTAPPTTAAPSAAPDCHPSYDPCVPIASDVDCQGGSGDGPVYTGRVNVIGPDEYDLDRDGDGVGCES